MEDIHTYQILVRGPVKEDNLKANSQLRLTVAETAPSATLLTVRTDQSGMIGLVRHLHGLGFVLLSITACP